LVAVLGRGAARAGEYLEKNYSRKMNTDDAIALALNALRESDEKELTTDNVEIARIPKASQTFVKLTRNEIEGFLNPARPKKE
jgi:20S proteasome alpha/beta subunit